jgi:two-component system sensor histidine kinase DesK
VAVQPVIAATDPTEGAAAATGWRWRPRGGWLIGPVLALVFLGYPIRAALEVDPTPERVLLSLAGTATFAGGFLWLLWTRGPYLAGPVGAIELLGRRATVAGLAALVVALNLGPTGGPESPTTPGPTPWLVLFFHTAAAAGLVLPRREAYAAVAALAAVATAVGSRADLAFMGLPTAAVGLWATSFAGQVAANAELRAAREELARRAVAEERLRFARDLHDLLGHSLSLITLKSELAGKLLPAAPERAATEIREVEQVARRALREVREAVAGYRQPTLGEELIGAKEMLAAAGIASRVENEAGPLPRQMDALLAWAVREGVTNVVRHSRAPRCTVRVARADGCVTAEVADDGRGASPVPDTRGSGLSGLAERVAEVAGAGFEAGPLPEGGFRLRVSLPLDGADEEARR